MFAQFNKCLIITEHGFVMVLINQVPLQFKLNRFFSNRIRRFALLHEKQQILPYGLFTYSIYRVPGSVWLTKYWKRMGLAILFAT